MSYFDDDATDRAAAAYARKGERSGLTLDQPSRSDSGREGDTVTLRSGGRLLARFRVRPDGTLRRSRPAKA